MESEFAVHLGHVYAHLNRVWNRRNCSAVPTDEEWEAFSQFPTDIKPVVEPNKPLQATREALAAERQRLDG